MSELLYFADLTHTGYITNNNTFPLGVGYVAAYAKRILGDELECQIFRFSDELNDALLARTPTMLCLNFSQWNANLALTFAGYVKERHPEVPVVMGGPNFSLSPKKRQEFLEKNPMVDFYVRHEGEHAFVELFKALREHGFVAEALRAEKPLLDNCVYLSGGEYVEGREQRIADLTTIPSPYTTGTLDKFFERGLLPVMEIVRGCPYACTFCCDADPQRSMVRRRTHENTRAELEYIVKRIKGAADLVLADLNFGMYKEDLETARIIRSFVDEYDWPKRIDCSPGKTHPERVLETVQIINRDGKGVLKFGSSLQSTDPDVLGLIQRKNLPVEKIIPALEARDDPQSDNTEYFTELILGLPGDSKERHFKSLRDAIDVLGMDIVNVHQLAILEGSPMALEAQRKMHGFELRYRVYVGALGIYPIGDERRPVVEFEEIVTATNSMTFDEWVECRVMSLLVKLYIDRDYFVEIFGLVRRLNLSVFDLLVHLRENFIDKYAKLADLIDLYIHKTKEPLYDDREELVRFATQSEVVEKFANGELGGNELLVHRAKGYVNCNDELHAALEDATLSYLKQHGVLDGQMERYVGQAVRFSKLRKVDFENPYPEEEDSFDFDLLAAKDRRFQVLPGEVKIEPARIRFSLGDLAREKVEFSLAQHLGRGEAGIELDGNHGRKNASIGAGNGKSAAVNKAQLEFNLGKLFHASNLKVIARTGQFVAPAAGSSGG